MGNSCEYTQSLRFGSSYTLLIPPSITFGKEVKFPSAAANKFQMRSVRVAARLTLAFVVLATSV